MSRAFKNSDEKLVLCLPVLSVVILFILVCLGDPNAKIRAAQELADASTCQRHQIDEWQSCKVYSYAAAISTNDTTRITFTWSPALYEPAQSRDVVLDYRIYQQLRGEKSTNIQVWRNQIVWITTKNGVVATDDNPLRAAGVIISAVEVVLALSYCGMLMLLEQRLRVARCYGTIACAIVLMVTIALNSYRAERAAPLNAYTATGVIGFCAMLAAVAVAVRAKKDPAK